MPKSPLMNPWMTGVRGRYDNLVFRQVRGKTVISPFRPRTTEPTVAQRGVQTRFKLAAGYASGVLTDTAKRQAYERAAETQNKPLFGVIIADYLKAPVIEQIDLGGYHGNVGDIIRVMATDDVGVVSVTVRILLPNQTVLEQGPATLHEGAWVYTATVAKPAGQTVRIEANALDRPQNLGQQLAQYP
jgi:hypothetical protein